MPAKNSSGRRRRQDDCVRKLLDWCVDKHLISDVVPTDERYERLRQIVEQVPRWAAYYQRQAREPIEHRRLAEECAEIAEHLEKFLDRRGRAVLLRFTSSGLMLQNAYEI